MNESKNMVLSDHIVELENTQKMAQLLLKTPHYAKLGLDGIFAIIETARSLGIDPMQALGGGLYYAKGKVEMSARMMNALIRSRGHSVTKDKKSDDSICILHGKRCDNGDHWTESFSIEEAGRANLLGNQVWKIYPRDMLFARALSRLARQLFPDLIGNVYVEGEISGDASIKDLPVPSVNINKIKIPQLNLLKNTMQPYEEALTRIILKQYDIEKLDDLTQDKFNEALSRTQEAIKYMIEKQKKDAEVSDENS